MRAAYPHIGFLESCQTSQRQAEAVEMTPIPQVKDYPFLNWSKDHTASSFTLIEVSALCGYRG
jgi:hypothetical protein